MQPPEAVGAGDVAVQLLLVFFLVLLNAFFVSAEFSLVAARRTRIEQEAARGDRGARRVQKTLKELDRYISATQLGITMASLALGWVGEPAMSTLFRWVAGLFGFDLPEEAVRGGAILVIAFLIVTFLHVVLGELAPKSLALTLPETVSKAIVLPLRFFARLLGPLIAVFNAAGNAVVRLFGIRPVTEISHVHSAEELRYLVIQSRAHGVLSESDSEMLAGVFDFHNKRVVDVMRPRTEVVALDIDASEDEIRELLRSEGYSRYPVYRETLDDVMGVFLAKDFWLRPAGEPLSLPDLLREALYVPDTRPAARVLDDLRRTRAHMAVVLDEYGGTAGIVTLEDLVEEVIGDIADEYDLAARTVFQENGVLELAGSLSLVDVRSDHQVPIPEGEWTTLGGYAFSVLGRLPRVGDRVPFPGGELEVVAMDGRRVAALRVHRSQAGHEKPMGDPS